MATVDKLLIPLAARTILRKFKLDVLVLALGILSKSLIDYDFF